MTTVLRSVDDVIAYVARVCFKTGPPGRVGVESEWLVGDASDPSAAVPIDRTAAALAGVHLPHGSVVSFEPGGQLELSGPPAAGAGGAVAALGADLAAVRPALARAGLRLFAYGTDPYRPPVRWLRAPRYDAMAAYFAARDGAAGAPAVADHPAAPGHPGAPGVPAGAVMMSSTAAVQVCVDVGHDAVDARRRWALAHALVPVLVGAFANSPLLAGRPTGWRSTRQRVWSRIDRAIAPPDGEPIEAYARHALAAPVMCIRREGSPWLVDPGCTFGEWLAGATPHPGPTDTDLDFHLSTLFPPIRPRGWLEIRCIDALPDPLWPVAVAVVAALLDDPVASDLAADACRPVAGLGLAAARHGLDHPAIATAALACFTAACEALPRVGAAALAPAVGDYLDRYVARCRCPADDVVAHGPAHVPAHDLEPA